MKTVDDGGPAFPCTALQPAPGGGTYSRSETGMSLRDWFAGMVLQGMLANNTTSGAMETFALDAYNYADAMLAEREGKVAK